MIQKFITRLFHRRPNYRAYLRSRAWRKRANDAKRRAGYRCQVCNGAENLQAHHRTYERLGHERPGDLTVLCDACHELFSRAGRLRRG